MGPISFYISFQFVNKLRFHDFFAKILTLDMIKLMQDLRYIESKMLLHNDSEPHCTFCYMLLQYNHKKKKEIPVPQCAASFTLFLDQGKMITYINCLFEF